MRSADVIKRLKDIDLSQVDYNDINSLREFNYKLLNIIEQMAHTIQELQEENQNLKDEINRLKGEKGKPKIKPNVPQKENDVVMFTADKPKKWKKQSKKSKIKIDKQEVLRVDPKILPYDAEHKGYRRLIKQDIKFETNNIEYLIERYYSPSEKKVYEAELPENISEDEFQSGLKTFIMYLYCAGRVTEPKIKKILDEAGIIISKGQISNILTKKNQEDFTREKNDILEAGLKSSEYFHTDSTGGRHKSINHHVHTVCNLFFTVLFITRYKNKNEIKNIFELGEDEKIDKIIITDDAKQYYFLSELHALCWIHEVRHYRKLNPFLEFNRIKLHNFLNEIWKFYEQLKEYKGNPNEAEKQYLEKRFDELFSVKTGYLELDRRNELTKKKKEKLLLVLAYPEIPLHNNPAEIALREMVIKKNISGGTRSEDGKIAWENMMSIMDTCRKNGVSFFSYVKDIFSEEYKMPIFE